LIARERNWGGSAGAILRIAMSGIGLIFVTGIGVSGGGWFLMACAVFVAAAPLVRWAIISLLAGCLMIIVSCVRTYNHIPWGASIAYLGLAVALMVVTRRTSSETH
jgi:hypothetical protein